MSEKARLQASIKSSGTAWILFLMFGAHYAYVGRWGVQLLFWFTLGGLGLWWFISLFLVGKLVRDYNTKIYTQIDSFS